MHIWLMYADVSTIDLLLYNWWPWPGCGMPEWRPRTTPGEYMGLRTDSATPKSALTQSHASTDKRYYIKYPHKLSIHNQLGNICRILQHLRPAKIKTYQNNAETHPQIFFFRCSVLS